MIGTRLKLYSFVDNHDVERIYTKLKNKTHFWPVHVMLYTLPGVPSIYYGSEFGIEGKKERYSDDSLRPALNYEDYKDELNKNPCTKLISELGKIRQNTPILCYGDYRELELHNTYFAYARTINDKSVIITVNNGDNTVNMNLLCGNSDEYVGALTGERISVDGGRINIHLLPNSGEIWIPAEFYSNSFEYVNNMPAFENLNLPNDVENNKTELQQNSEPDNKSVKTIIYSNKKYEDMSVEELQEAILEKMRQNGPVTDYMLGTVRENVYHDSLINWVKSFH